MTVKCTPVHRDFFGFELEVGDQVALINPGYKELIAGKVTKLNAKMVTVEYERRGYRGKSTVSRYASDLVKRVFDPDQVKMMKFAMGIEDDS